MALSKLKYSVGLGNKLATIPTKLDWAGMIMTTLGNNRRLICFNDPNGGADPFATGTEFLNLASTGDMKVRSGNISSFGLLSNAITNKAVDLSKGTSAVRIVGNGEWFQATLGLPGSGADYLLPQSPTGAANIGYGFTLGTGVKAPVLLPSGTGPVAPPIRSATPTIIELWDCMNESTPVVVGIATFKEANRIEDWVYQQPEMAAETGDVAVYLLDQTIKWTNPIAPRRFELGGVLMIASQYNSETGGVPLEQMGLVFKPYGRWESYPAMDTFIKADRDVVDASVWPYIFGPCKNPDTADRTVLPPFMVKLYTVAGYKNGAADRTPVFVHQWDAFNEYPNMPINSSQVPEIQSTTQPSMPRFHCGQVLPWYNTRTRMSSKAGKFFSGVESWVYEGDILGTLSGSSANAYAPLSIYETDKGTMGTQIDSTAHWLVLPPYPLRADTAVDNAYLTAYESRPRDARLFTNRDHYSAYRIMGFKYQQGGIGGHDWITGKGGVRFDRSPVPSAVAIFATNQNWKRPEGNIPIRDLMEEWGKNYFNHGNHWVRNVLTMESIPKADILAGKWLFVGSYYGNDPAILQGNSKANLIDIVGIPNGKGRWADRNDPEGFMYYGGWQRDFLHSYCNAGWFAVLMNSPLHAFFARHDFETQWMCSLGNAKPQINFLTVYTVREHAWRMLAYVFGWMVSTEHSRGYSMEEIEARLQIELELLYDQVYKPAFIDNDQSVYSAAIRNLGAGAIASGTGYQTPGGSIGLYMVHTLVLMKQFGMFAAMRRRSYKCRDALDMMIRNLDKFVIDYVLDSKMRDCYYPVVVVGKDDLSKYTGADVPADWSAQSQMLDMYQPVLDPSVSRGSVDQYGTTRRFKSFFEAYDGRYEEHPGCPHMYLQYLTARKHYFPEYPAPRLDAAITKMRQYYQDYLDARTAQKAYKMAYLYPSHGPLLPPTEVTPN